MFLSSLLDYIDIPSFSSKMPSTCPGRVKEETLPVVSKTVSCLSRELNGNGASKEVWYLWVKSLTKQAALTWLPFFFHWYQGLCMSLTKVTETSRNSHHPQPALDWTCFLPEWGVLGSEQGWLKPRCVSSLLKHLEYSPCNHLSKTDPCKWPCPILLSSLNKDKKKKNLFLLFSSKIDSD